jgi:hypothetical protein
MVNGVAAPFGLCFESIGQFVMRNTDQKELQLKHRYLQYCIGTTFLIVVGQTAIASQPSRTNNENSPAQN